MTTNKIMNNIERTHKLDLLTNLLSQEEQKINGGINPANFETFFFQQTEITSFAEDSTNISNNGNLNISSNSRTGYSFRQITLGFTSLFSRNSRFNPISLIFRLFR
ncbi:hypothetical protein [Scytonema sp. NUACC26]|uniref:hypothetical protein n=1 Tax=Scytonema sp. NUACC26 TaxID=3140176 RepID=UPI0034DC92F8